MRAMAPLDDLLAAVTAIVRRRELATAGLWALAIGGLGVLLGAVVVAATLRGDLAAPVLLIAWGLTAGALSVRGLRRGWRLGGTRHRAALTIAQNRRPLTRPSAAGKPEGALAADLALRREILGAVELRQAFDAGPGDALLVGSTGSPDLAAAYVLDVAARVRDREPGLAAPPLRLRTPTLILAAVALTGAVLSSDPGFTRGLVLLLSAEDATPPTPPEPLWSSLAVTLTAPPHAARPPRNVQNPSGKLRVLAGTRVDLALTPRRPFTHLHVVVSHDPAEGGSAPAPERSELAVDPSGTWTGSFLARGAGSWRLVADDDTEVAPSFPLELEPDEPPEVELAPLPRSQGDPSERDLVELRFKASDDFGLAQAALVFEGPDEQEIRLDAGPPPPGARTWQHRYTWDLSSVALGDRRELTYWIEVRDNDPGLSQTPLDDPPGKPARSARMRLTLRDEEREHAENLADLAALRDAAVDLLARRMISEEPAIVDSVPVREAMSDRSGSSRDVAAVPPTVAAAAAAPTTAGVAAPPAASDRPTPRIGTVAPSTPISPTRAGASADRPASRTTPPPRADPPDDLSDPLDATSGDLTDPFAGPPIDRTPELRALRGARGLLTASEQLLTGIREALDALSVDALTPPRDVAILTAIHRRLMDLHRREAALHAEVPPDGEVLLPIGTLLPRLAAINRQLRAQLEDEIIRLDDLVDEQVVARIEQLVARLQASQQKLVDLLEKLKAGDESVRGEIDQLQQRTREDLRRLAEARSRLNKEVGQEFLNLDAFQALENRMRNQDVAEQLRQGDVDGALDQARGALDQLRQLRDDVQERLADNQARDDIPMSPQDRARMQMMRELSRIQDEEVGLRSDTRALHQQWRKQAEASHLDASIATKIGHKAAAVRKELDAVNDARLGRDGRRALEDAREHLQRLEGEAAAGPARALQSFEAAQSAAQALQRAAAGAGERSAERRDLERASSQAQRLVEQLAGELPAPGAGLSPERQAQYQAAQQRQAGLRGRAQQLLDGSDAQALLDPGKQALRAALDGMQESDGALDQRRGGPAIDAQSEAIAALQRALDSLRDTSPPTGAASHQPTSTETDRDRSLRDELMDAMKEGAPAGFDREVERYYEELLR